MSIYNIWDIIKKINGKNSNKTRSMKDKEMDLNYLDNLDEKIKYGTN